MELFKLGILSGFLLTICHFKLHSAAFESSAKDGKIKSNNVLDSESSSEKLPVFTEQPVDSFVIKNRPAILNCSVIHSDKAYFTCNGEAQAKSGDHVEKDLVDEAGRVVRILSLVIYREQVEEFFDEFRCQCDAWSSRGLSSSRPATVASGFLNKEFEVPPYSQSVELGSQVEMRCHPPLGKPEPKISWMKNKVEIVAGRDSNYLKAADGHLIIVQVRPEDVANYTCVAENLVNRRVSQPARLELVVDGGWSSWSPWSDCPSRCGPGERRRQRVCNNPAASGLGRQCRGETQQSQECHQLCAVAGSWSSWSSWSTCSPNCTQYKRRACNDPPPANGGEFCPGEDHERGGCAGGMCTPGHLSADSVSVVVTDLSLVIGLGVAVTVFLCVTSLAVRIIRSKRTSHSVYNMADIYYQSDPAKEGGGASGGGAGAGGAGGRSRWHETNFSWPGARQALVGEESDKQLLRLAGDWPGSVQTTPLLHTKTVNLGPSPAPNLATGLLPSAGASHTLPGAVLSPSKSEHQYDVPWSHLLPRKTLAVDSSGGGDYSDIVGGAGPGAQAGDRSAHQSPWSVSDDTSLSSSDSLPAGVSLPQLQLTPDNFTVASVSHTGCKLSLPTWGVSLVIPPQALDTGFVEEVFLAVVPLPQPPLSDCQVMLSPVVLAGPPGLHLARPAILSLPQCAGGGGEEAGWEAALWHTPSMVSSSSWDRLLTVGQQGTGPVFARLDLDQCHVISPWLGHYCLTGQPGPDTETLPTRHFKIVSCGQTSSLSLYVVPDTPGSVEHAVKLAERAGGRLLTKPRHVALSSALTDLQCGVVNTGQGWFVRPVKAEIKARDLKLCYDREQPAMFSLELEQIVSSLHSVSLELIVSQSGPGISKESKHSLVRLTISTDQQSSNRSSSGCSSLSTSPQSPPSSQLRLSPAVRLYLSSSLDSPPANWRLLAAGLRLPADLVTWLDSQPSPTDTLLSLWEAGQTDPAAVTELVNVLRVCVSPELATTLHREAGSWV